MITGHGSIVSTNDKKSKSRFGFDMTIPYYSNLIKAVQSTTTYDNDNIRKNIWNISFRCTGVTFQHHHFRFLKSWEFHQKKKFYPCIWTATIWNFWAQTYYFTTVWRHESCKESEIIRLRGVYNFCTTISVNWSCSLFTYAITWQISVYDFLYLNCIPR